MARHYLLIERIYSPLPPMSVRLTGCHRIDRNILLMGHAKLKQRL